MHALLFASEGRCAAVATVGTSAVALPTPRAGSLRSPGVWTVDCLRVVPRGRSESDRQLLRQRRGPKEKLKSVLSDAVQVGGRAARWLPHR